MNWDEGTWDTGYWDDGPAPPPPPTHLDQPKRKNTMKRQNYYPSRLSEQAAWLENYRLKMPIHGAALSQTPAEIAATVNDAGWGVYVLLTWLSAVRAFSPSTTDAVEDVLEGTGSTAIVLPTFVPPALPSGVTAALPGILTRIFGVVARIKTADGYNEIIGADLGVIGPEETPKDQPKFTPTLEQGTGCQCVRLAFFKYGHMGVYIESRRGATGVWELLAIDTESPYLDERPLLVAGTPEVREYRMRFWDKGTPNGPWTPVAAVTVSP